MPPRRERIPPVRHLPPMPPPSPAPPRFDPARRKRVTFALLLVSGLAAFEATVVTTAMPTIIGDLSGLSLYSWVFSVFLLTTTIAMPVYGRLADVLGRRRVLLGAIGLFTVGAIACALARSMPQLVVARAIQGFGAGGLIPMALTVSGDLYSVHERARIQGLFSSVWGTASLAGPLAGAALTVGFGWRSVFVVAIPMAMVAAALVWTQMIESIAPSGDPIDWPGIATLSASVALMLGAFLRDAESPGPPLAVRLALLAAAAAAFALFVRIERRTAHPLVPIVLFTDPATRPSYLSGILLGTSIYGVDTFVPLFVQGVRGGSAGAAGAVITPFVLCWALSATLGARAAVRFGFRATARFGSALVVLGCAGLLAAVVWDAPVLAASLATGLVGAGLGPTSITQILSVQSVVPAHRRGVSSSLVPFVRVLGGSVGVGILGGILAGGLAARLGPAAADASAILAGRAPSGNLDPATFRHALELSMRPLFAALLLLAIVNVAVASAFPAGALARAAEPAPPADDAAGTGAAAPDEPSPTAPVAQA